MANPTHSIARTHHIFKADHHRSTNSVNVRKGLYCLLVFLLPLIASCASTSVGEQFQAFYWDIQKSMRKPGEKLLTHPNKVHAKYNCATRRLPFFQIEKNEILPPRLYAGKELNHHLIYVMCPAKPSQIISGKLTRSIYYKSRSIFKDVIKNFEFKPGEWSIDAFIKVPEAAEPGVYSLEVAFSGKGTSFRENQHFVVTAPAQ